MLGVATNFYQAARRHQHDAALLHGEGRLGGADHLYGLAAECALKAILVGLGEIKNPDKPQPYKKHIETLWGQFDAYMQGHGAQRYGLPSGKPFDKWHVEQRYEDDAWFATAPVDDHRQAAAQTIALLQKAVVDGVISP